MNAQNPSSASPSPINKLANDVLWCIFLINADMFDPLEFDIQRGVEVTKCSALLTTLRTSLVCRRWRALLLGWPAIWGRVIRLDKLFRFRGGGRDEILRRTGTAPLCVLGKIPDSEHLLAGFLAPLMQKNWKRMQKVHLYGHDVSKLPGTFWRILTVEAPLLEWFALSKPRNDIRGLFASGGSQSKLFGNSAPSLRLLHVPMLAFSLDSPQWLARLRSLNLDSMGMSAKGVLNAITQMPLLEFLDLDHLAGEIDPHSVKPESIHLPHLVDLRISLSTPDSLAFAQSIKPARNCALSYTPRSVAHEKWDCKAFANTVQVVDRYAACFFSDFTPMDMEFRMSNLEFLLVVRHLAPVPQETCHRNPPCFVVKVNWWSLRWDLNDDTVGAPLLESLSKYDLSAVNNLNLGMLDIKNPFALSFINSLTGVESLSTVAANLETITLCYEKNSDTLFPRLRALHLSDGYTSSRQFQPTYDMLVSQRKQTNCPPLEILDIGYKPVGNWDFLEFGMEGLKVKWKSYIEEEHEYVCGSGKAGKLRFDADSDSDDNVDLEDATDSD